MIPRDAALVLEFYAAVALPDGAEARILALLGGEGGAGGGFCGGGRVACGRYGAVVLWRPRGGCGGFGGAIAGEGLVLLHGFRLLVLLLVVGDWRFCLLAREIQ